MNALSQAYFEDGFGVIPAFATPTEVAALRARADALLADFDPASVPRSIFSTGADRQVNDAYFLASSAKIAFFFEPGAFDAQGRPTVEKAFSINKIGHALHALDPVFKAFSFQPRVQDIARALGYKSPLLAQSMYIFKQPGIGGYVAPHQDSTFLYTEPMSCCGLWIALQDATEENGCLWVVPGSHRHGIEQRFVRREQGTAFVALGGGSKDTHFVPLPVTAGTCVVLHGALVHKSEQNHSPMSRHAYSLHFTETVQTQYAPDNWLQSGAFEALY